MPTVLRQYAALHGQQYLPACGLKAPGSITMLDRTAQAWVHMICMFLKQLPFRVISVSMVIMLWERGR